MIAADQPLSHAEADRALALLERFDRIVLAVSGGPDSMALMHLAAGWRRRHDRASSALLVVTVDHGLRSTSAEEAVFVARSAQALGFEHRTLRWEGAKPSAGLPEAARLARYALLEQATIEFAGGIPAALGVAHTQDDQAETVLMRLARGSGVEGLSAMRPTRQLGQTSLVTLARPLLDVPKARLIATLKALGAAWIDDPTNVDRDYERPRVREALRSVQAIGVGANALATSAHRLQQASQALAYADGQFSQHVALQHDRGILALLDSAAFRAGPALLRQRLLTRLIRRYGGDTPEPRLSEVEALVEQLDQHSDRRVTLGGVMISQGGRTLRVWREAGRVTAEPLVLKGSGANQIWDARFKVSYLGAPEAPMQVRALGAEGLARIAQLNKAEVERVPSRALAALPAFYLNGTLIGVPTIGYQEQVNLRLTAQPIES